jgi:alpha-glucosidase
MLIALTFAAAIGSTVATHADAGDADAWLSSARVGTVPESLNIDPFYAKHVDVLGLPVVSSARVADAALLEAGYWLHRMLENRPDVAEAIVAGGVRFAVLAAGEFTTDIPEYADLEPKDYWDRRARGLGSTPERPVVSCGEENLLRLEGDPYLTESILIHEFAHTFHQMGLNVLAEDFDARLSDIYGQAMDEGLWEGKYAASNPAEYWAEGVQSYFDTNRPPDHDHNHVDTRAELAEYDPRLFRLIDEAFRQADWHYTGPEQRPDQPHLRGLDRAALPTFAWPARLDDESRQLDERKRQRPQ